MVQEFEAGNTEKGVLIHENLWEARPGIIFCALKVDRMSEIGSAFLGWDLEMEKTTG